MLIYTALGLRRRLGRGVYAHDSTDLGQLFCLRPRVGWNVALSDRSFQSTNATDARPTYDFSTCAIWQGLVLLCRK